MNIFLRLLMEGLKELWQGVDQGYKNQPVFLKIAETGKIGRYSSVGDFTVHIFNQMDFGQFLSNLVSFFENQ
jgi:hypothetical protein